MKINSNNMMGANEELLSLKSNSRDELLNGLPEVFAVIMNYLDEIKFATAPDYERIRGLLSALMKKNGYELDYKYDWEYL